MIPPEPAPPSFDLLIEIGGVVYPAKLTPTRIAFWHPKGKRGGSTWRPYFSPGRTEYDLTTLRHRGHGERLPSTLRVVDLEPATSPSIRAAVIGARDSLDRSEAVDTNRRDWRARMHAAEAALLTAAQRGEDLTALAQTYRTCWKAAHQGLTR